MGDLLFVLTSSTISTFSTVVDFFVFILSIVNGGAKFIHTLRTEPAKCKQTILSFFVKAIIVCFIFLLIILFAFRFASSDALISAVEANIEAEDYDGAIYYSNQLIKNDGNNATAFLLRGRAYELQGKYEKAIEDYNHVISLDSDNVQAYSEKGDILYYQEGNLTLALEAYENAHRLNPNDLSIINKIDDIRKTQAVEENYQNNLVGIWTGYYYSDGRKNGLTLEINRCEAGNISATFNFYTFPGETAIPEGSYTMEGSIASDDTFVLKGCQWINQPTGFRFLDIWGVWDQEQERIYGKSSENDTSYTIFLSRDTSSGSESASDGPIYLSTVYVKPTDVAGIMMNNNYSTYSGQGFPEDYYAKSFDSSYQDVISICSMKPMTLNYNVSSFPKDCTTLKGYVAFDDLTPANNDLTWGGGSMFQGVSTVYVYGITGDDTQLIDQFEISVEKTPTEFSFTFSNYDSISIVFDYPYMDWFQEEFNKYINVLDAHFE